jgi:hypothetical protein
MINSNLRYFVLALALVQAQTNASPVIPAVALGGAAADLVGKDIIRQANDALGERINQAGQVANGVVNNAATQLNLLLANAETSAERLRDTTL